MYLPYANLVHFTTSPTFGAPSEAAVTLQVLDWVGEVQDLLDANYVFTTDYLYSPMGFVVDASILVQHKVDGVWLTIGRFSPVGTPLSSIIATSECDTGCTPSDIVSDPLHYYVEEYYDEDYYV